MSKNATEIDNAAKLGGAILLAFRVFGGMFIFMGAMTCLGSLLAFLDGEQEALFGLFFGGPMIVIGLLIFRAARKIGQRISGLFALRPGEENPWARAAATKPHSGEQHDGEQRYREQQYGRAASVGEMADEDREAEAESQTVVTVPPLVVEPKSQRTSVLNRSGRLQRRTALHLDRGHAGDVKVGANYRVTAAKVLVVESFSRRRAIVTGLLMMLPAAAMTLGLWYGYTPPDVAFVLYPLAFVGFVVSGKRSRKCLDGKAGVVEDQRRAWWFQRVARQSLKSFEYIRVTRVRIPLIGGSARVRDPKQGGMGVFFLVQLVGGRRRFGLSVLRDFRQARDLATAAAGVTGLGIREELR